MIEGEPGRRCPAHYQTEGIGMSPESVKVLIDFYRRDKEVCDLCDGVGGWDEYEDEDDTEPTEYVDCPKCN